MTHAGAVPSQSGSVNSSNKSRTSLLMIFLTVLIDMIGFGIVIPILPLYAVQFHATTTQIGLLFASFSFMQLIFAPLLGRWSDRVGRRPVLIASILGSALAFITLGLANSLPLLFLGRMLDGASGGNISTAQAYIADVTPKEKRGAAMGIIGAAFGLGFVIGPAIGGWLGHISIQAPFFVAAALALLNTLGVLFVLPESLPPERRIHAGDKVQTVSFGEKLALVRQSGLSATLFCIFLCTMSFALVTALLTLFTSQRLHWHALENGNLFAYSGVIGVLVQGGFLRRMAPKIGEKPLIILGAALLLIGMALLPYEIPGQAATSIWFVIIGVTSLSVGNSLVTPLLNAVASQSADERSQGTIMGITQSIASLGRLVGPAVGGFLLAMDASQDSHPYGLTPFWASAILMLLGVWAASQLRPHHKAKASAEVPLSM